ncbi:hypothetical protein BIU82_10410 [Arthrobacter sp. SW1]|nr:hypothetical protein BIU82_10410 [Arthrobacter sp. SW1]
MGNDDARYRSGFLAGHFAGWQEAAARFGPPSLVPPVPRGPASHFIAQPVAKPQAAAVPAAPPRPAPTVAPMTPPAPPPTPEELAAKAERKAKRERQNINITLYVASLLLVASAALFIGSGLPAALRFAGVWVITVLFYAGGFILAAKAPRLRAAALAFTGTGLALIPVTGLAMYNFVLHHGPSAWLVTSLAGTAAYVFAAVRLDSKVLAYLSLTFVVSSAWSGVSMLGGALVWYFVALIGLAVVLGIANLSGLRGVPSIYLRPLQVLHPCVVPFVAVAATFAPRFLGPGDYALIMAMCGLYLAVASAFRSTPGRKLHFLGARACLTVAATVAVSDAGAGLGAVLYFASLLLGLQSIGVAFASAQLDKWFPVVPARPRPDDHATTASEPGGFWRLDALVGFVLQLSAVLVATVMLVPQRELPLALPFYSALVCALVLAWKLRGSAELLPAGVLLAASPFVPSLGGGPTAVLLLAAAVAWGLRCVLPGTAGIVRRRFVLAARIALTLAVPAFLMAALPASAERPAVAVLGFITACLAQLVFEAGAVRTGLQLHGPDASLAGFGAAAVVFLPFVWVLEAATGDHMLSATTAVAIGAASAVAGFLLSGREGARRPGLRDGLAPAMMLAAGLFAFTALPLIWGNFLLVLGVGYFTGQAVRPGNGLQRQLHAWAARTAFTLLLCTAYLQFLDAGGALVFFAESVSPAAVVFAACGVQLVVALMKAARRLRAAAGESAVALAFMAMAWAFLSLSEPGSWQHGGLAVALAVAAAAAGFLLRRTAASVAFAPAAFFLLLVFGPGGIHQLELVLGVFAVFCAVMVAASAGPTAKGVHFAAVRVLTAALAGVLAYDLAASVTVVSLTLAAVFLAQHVVQCAARRLLAEVPFQHEAVWITLAAQAVLPLVYIFQQADDGGRWVLLLELLLLGCSAFAADRFLAATGARYIAIPATVALVLAAGLEIPLQSPEWLGVPLLDRVGMVVALLAPAAAVMAVRLRITPGPAADRWFWLWAAAVFIASAYVLAIRIDAAAGASLLLGALLCFEASHLERMPKAYLGAVPLSLAGATVLASGLPSAGEWTEFLPWLCGCSVAAGLLYAGYRGAPVTVRGEQWRRLPLLAGSLGGLGVSAVVGLLRDATALAGTGLLAAAAVIVVVEVPRKYAWPCGEAAAVLLLAAVQRALLFASGRTPDFFWAAQWFVVLGAVLAVLCYIRSRGGAPGTTGARGRMIAAAALFTVSAAGTLLAGTAPQQLWVLAGFVLLLVAGLLLGERIFTWWGALGVAASVLWAMRAYAFALLALTALALIGFAVWRLNRTKEAPAPVAEGRPVDPRS